MVKKQLFMLFFVIGWTLWVSVTQAGITAQATVDRKTISEQDTLSLTIRIDDTGTYTTPNLSGIEKDFNVLGTNQNNRHSIINGQSSSYTEWIVSLVPKRVGRLHIPPIKIDGATTHPITINVTASTPVAPGELQPLFLESTVSHSEAFVQQQLIYTLRIFHSIQIESPNLTQPEFDNATVKELPQQSFRRQIKGTTYRVHEISYAIFPQQEGEFIIPEQVFTAHQATGRRSLFQRFGQGQRIRRVSEQITVNIKAPPRSIGNTPWLPANALTLEENWSASPRELRVGESITRTITVDAEGVMAAHLPPISFPQTPSVKLYPDKGQTENKEEAHGIIARRIDSTAIIPTKAGKLVLPAIRIDWWDVKAKKMRQAVIPASTHTVLPSLEQQTISTAPRSIDHSPSTISSTPPPQVITVSNPFWMWLSLVTSLLWVITGVAYWRLRAQLLQFNNSTSIAKPTSLNTVSEAQAFKLLAQACSDQDLNATRTALINWAASRWPDKRINSLEDIRKNINHQALSDLLLQLDCILFGKTKGEEWQAKELLSIIRLLRKKPSSPNSKTENLSPLYQ